jgi:hypothetical protein
MTAAAEGPSVSGERGAKAPLYPCLQDIATCESPSPQRNVRDTMMSLCE